MKTNPQSTWPRPDGNTQRIDTWLWVSRFFKTRRLANEAVLGGHVWLNGQRCKPAKAVQPGDRLRIRRAAQEFTVVIAGLSPKRLGAALAADLYRETPASQAAREEQAMYRKAQRHGVQYDSRRPGPRARDTLRRIKHQRPEQDAFFAD